MPYNTIMIRAYTQKYSREALEKMRDEAMERLNAGDYITQATTGAGTGYTRAQRISPQEQVEFLQACIDTLDGRDRADDLSACHPVIFLGHIG